MNILLDTNVLIWVLSRRARLAEGAIAEIERPENEVFFSPVNIWELAIKYRLAQPDFADHPQEVLTLAQAAGYRELPLTAATAATIVNLPMHHRDPFDRVLVAQAIANPCRLYTSDRSLLAYSELVTLVR